MAKGQEAKNYIAKKLAEIFKEDYLGEIDRKYYVLAPEAGEKIQIAIAMTCPKTPVATSTAPVIRSGGMDFEADAPLVAPVATKEVTQEERDTIADMMRRLGL